MADDNYLPRGWAKAMQNAAAASSAMRNMLLMYDPRYAPMYTHFLGDALTAEWPAAVTNGTSAAVTVASSRLTLTTGTDDNGYAGQGYGLFWSGDRGYFFESKQAIDSAADSKWEVGITDAITGDAGAVNAWDTPTCRADDCVILGRDTDSTADTVDVISRLDAGTAVLAVDSASDVFTLVGGTYFTTEFRAQNDLVAVFINGRQPAYNTAPSLQGGDLVTPWWFAQARAATDSKIMTVDYALMIGPEA